MTKLYEQKLKQLQVIPSKVKIYELYPYAWYKNNLII